MPTALPLEPTQRNPTVDIVRGFALIGVLFANSTSYNQQNIPPTVLDSISNPLDKTLMVMNSVLIEWKFITLFSILFGYGFGLILQSLERQHIHPLRFFGRRMAWLFVIGVIHTLFWWGDILHIYAVCGLLLLAFRKLTARTILICAVAFMFVIPPVIEWLFHKESTYFTYPRLLLILEQYRSGSLLDVFKTNLELYYYSFITTLDDLRDIAETLGRFLFGYFLVRIHLFENIETKKGLFNKIVLITLPFAIAYISIRWPQAQEGYGPPVQEVIRFKDVLMNFFIKLGILSTACFYASMLILLFIMFGKNKFFAALQALGKMTLTNYLLISAFLTVLLYGFGFGKLGLLPMRWVWLYAMIWLVVEIVFSLFWLKRFKYGPIEWIWRQLTYNKRIRLRR